MQVSHLHMSDHMQLCLTQITPIKLKVTYVNSGVKYLAYCNYRTEEAKAPVLHKAFAMARS